VHAYQEFSVRRCSGLPVVRPTSRRDGPFTTVALGGLCGTLVVLLLARFVVPGVPAVAVLARWTVLRRDVRRHAPVRERLRAL
jgi:hypothetical protein